MRDYSKSKIYTIKIKDDNAIYIGSTIQELKQRFREHKHPKETTSISKYIKEKYSGDWSVCNIEVYENYSCNSRVELNQKEGEVIKTFKANNDYNCLNQIIQGRDKKQYYIDNKEYLDNRNKEYAVKNKEKEKERRKKWYEANKEKIKEKCKKWSEANREKMREYAKKSYYKNYELSKEKQKERANKWREENREKYNEYMKTYMKKNKIKSD